VAELGFAAGGTVRPDMSHALRHPAHVARRPVDAIFPPVEAGRLVPYWRLVLRGCSQMCLQSNELTGFCILAAAFVASPIAGAYLLVAGIMAPAGRILLGERRKDVLATGLPGLNPSLIALSLPTFFETGWTDVGMWVVLVACVASTLVLTRVFVLTLPFPILALPFLLTFWGLDALAPHVAAVQALDLESAGDTVLHPLKAVLHGLGEAVFSPTVISGLLVLLGIWLSNWRHGVLAVLGATIGAAVSYYYSNVAAADVDLGLYSFNGVLTAIAVFVLCGGKLRLAILGALLATILTPAIAEIGLATLSAPFVLTTWFMLLLGWIEDHWFRPPPEDGSPPPATRSATDTEPAAAPGTPS
jgi:urea transporter